MTSTYFISDLHLQKIDSPITNIFLHFLKNIRAKADALYILGDLFETWIGDDDHSSFATTIKTALKNLVNSGVTVYFIHGNRDFILGQRFADETGIHLLTDPTVHDIYGHNILLMHGDLLCIDDVKYQTFRRKMHDPKFQERMLKLPLWVRRLIACWARYKSKQHTKATDLNIQDVNLNEVQRYMQQYHTNLLIHGHTHRPHTHELMINGDTAKRIVLAAWHQHGHFLRLDYDGTIENGILLT